MSGAWQTGKHLLVPARHLFPSSSGLRGAPLHHDFGLQAFDITIDRGNCEHAAKSVLSET
jgi:hypothetical protein